MVALQVTCFHIAALGLLLHADKLRYKYKAEIVAWQHPIPMQYIKGLLVVNSFSKGTSADISNHGINGGHLQIHSLVAI